MNPQLLFPCISCSVSFPYILPAPFRNCSRAPCIRKDTPFSWVQCPSVLSSCSDKEPRPRSWGYRRVTAQPCAGLLGCPPPANAGGTVVQGRRSADRPWHLDGQACKRRQRVVVVCRRRGAEFCHRLCQLISGVMLGS